MDRVDKPGSLSECAWRDIDGEWHSRHCRRAPTSQDLGVTAGTRSRQSFPIAMPTLPVSSPITDIAPAAPEIVREYFGRLLTLETDCWDVHAAMQTGTRGFVLLDVRSPTDYATGHLPGAANLPHRTINERSLRAYARDTVFVVYCNGPHCNGADRAAIRLASLERPVKKMIGGVEGWKDEGFPLER
jgi:rhodanese-related sulfurtransferase